MILKRYKCLWNDKDCNKSKYVRIKNFKTNFYTDYIEKELVKEKKIKKKYEKIKTYLCTNCRCVYNNPWFDENTSKKIYSFIYGQHHKGWKNLINFVKNGKSRLHGDLYTKIFKKVKIKNYAEYNRPLVGMYYDITFKEKKRAKLNDFFNSIIELNKSKQLAGKSENEINKIKLRYKKNLRGFESLKRSILSKDKISKYLITDNSSMTWGENDNYKSINSQTFSREFFNLKTLNLNEASQNRIKYDLFGFFLTLDHSSDPNKILMHALKNSKLVIIHGHINPQVTKQHYFSITSKFPEFLRKKRIFVKNISKLVIGNQHERVKKEIYLLCTKKNKYLKNLNL